MRPNVDIIARQGATPEVVIRKRMMQSANEKDRRRFLKFLAASPLAALPAAAWQTPPGVIPLTGPKDAFSVMDFEAEARRVLPGAHFGYMASGVDDDLTL